MTHPQPTTAAHNKQVMQDLFAELARGNRKPFRERMADEIRWTITGSSKWSRTWVGKPAVLDELLRPLFALFADEYTATADHIIAEGDHVVVQCRGRVTTKAGKPYHNTYCNVYRLADGKICEVTEYCDTALISAVL